MKLAVALVCVAAAAGPARADGGMGDALTILIIAPAIGLDIGATTAFTYEDLAHDRGAGYGIAEVSYNTLVGRLYRDDLLDGGDDLAIAGSLAHGALVVDGVARIAGRRGWSTTGTVLDVGLALSLVAFVEPDDVHHGRAYATAETAVAAPLALGYAYLTYADIRASHDGRAALAATGAVVAGTLVADAITGLRRWPRHVTPTVIEDGVGLGTSGRW